MTGRLALVFFLVCTLATAASLDQVMAAMDKSSAAFRDMSAGITRVDHTAVINDTSQESGTVRMMRAGAGDVRLRIEFTEPDPRTVVFEKATARIYNPKIQTVQVYDLGKQRSLVDQFLLLGFGTAGAELARNYVLKALAEETVAGERTTRLELVPRTASVQEHLKRAELWITAAGYPAQQKFHRPSGDYSLITYRDVRINTGLAAAALRLSLPKGVKTLYPQK